MIVGPGTRNSSARSMGEAGSYDSGSNASVKCISYAVRTQLSDDALQDVNHARCSHLTIRRNHRREHHTLGRGRWPRLAYHPRHESLMVRKLHLHAKFASCVVRSFLFPISNPRGRGGVHFRCLSPVLDGAAQSRSCIARLPTVASGNCSISALRHRNEFCGRDWVWGKVRSANMSRVYKRTRDHHH